MSDEATTRPARPDVRVLVIPKAYGDREAWDKLVEKFKAFRLFSLEESPEAFSSTLQNERAFTKDVWANRLSNPRATALVAIFAPKFDPELDDSTCMDALLQQDWLALTVLIRPVDNDASKLSASKSPWKSTENSQDDPKDSTTGTARDIVFVLNGVYVVPGARHMGVGAINVQASFEAGIRVASKEGVSRVHFQVRVDSANVSAVRLYEKCGFEAGEREELMMAWKEKDGVLIPPREVEILVLNRWVILPQSEGEENPLWHLESGSTAFSYLS